jgi:hypothetical protein
MLDSEPHLAPKTSSSGGSFRLQVRDYKLANHCRPGTGAAVSEVSASYWIHGVNHEPESHIVMFGSLLGVDAAEVVEWRAHVTEKGPLPGLLTCGPEGS